MANALIVGAGSGISAAVAHRLARSGHSVALAARRPETLASLAKEIGAHVVTCDAAVREDVDQLVAGLRERWQQLDVVLYNAVTASAGRWSPLTRWRSSDRSRSAHMAAFWSHSRPPGGCCGRGAVRFC